RQWDVSQDVEPANKAGDDQKNCPPHEGGSQTIDPRPGKGAVRFRNVCCAAFQKKLGHQHAGHTQAELQPWVAETGTSIAFWLISRVGCHVERSRDISYCEEVRRGSENKARHSSTSLGMTRTSSKTGGAALKLIGIGKSRQNRIVPGWSEIFDHATKCRIQHSAGMPRIEVERHQFAIEMQLRLVV